MAETLYGFPITSMDMDGSYLITWKKVTLVLHNQTKQTPRKNILFLDIFSNSGAKGEGIALLCHILRKLKEDPTSGVNEETLVRLYASANCKDSACQSNSSIHESRYSKKNINLVRYYERYGFEQESDDPFWMQASVVKLLAKCQEGGFISRRSSRTTRSTMSRRSSRQPRRNKKSRRIL